MIPKPFSSEIPRPIKRLKSTEVEETKRSEPPVISGVTDIFNITFRLRQIVEPEIQTGLREKRNDQMKIMKNVKLTTSDQIPLKSLANFVTYNAQNKGIRDSLEDRV